MKLIDKDALIAEIERLKAVYNDDENIHHVAKYNILVDILSFLDSLEVKEVQEEPVSDDLEEAIGQSFIYHENRGDDFRSDKQIETAYRYGFKTGAKWQKEQMMTGAVDGEVGYWNQQGLSVLMSLPSEFEEDDKCKVILIKED